MVPSVRSGGIAASGSGSLVAESLRGRARVSEEVEALFIGKEGTANSEGIGEFGRDRPN
jgi:hypothetical protein